MADDPGARPVERRREDDPAGAAADLVRRLGRFESFYRSALADSVRHAGRVPAQAGAPPWLALGPRNIGGRIRDLIQDPNAPATLYAGSAFGGVWRTRDGGGTWEALGGVADAVPVGSIAIAADSSTLYVGTGEPVIGHVPGSGLFSVALAADPAACVFTRLAGTPDPAPGAAVIPGAANRYARLRVDPRNAARVWAACALGLWRREGTTFVQEVETDEKDVTDVAIDAREPGAYHVYLGIRGEGVYGFTFDGVRARSSDWRKLLGLSGRIRVALCSSQPEHVFAIGSDGHDFPTPVHHSADRGEHWDDGDRMPKAGQAGDSGQAYYDLVLEAHPDHPNLVIAGTVDLFRSVNFGGTWVRIIKWEDEDEDPGRHGDQHAVVFDRSRPRALWVGNDGGVTFSPNLGHTWRKRSYGILAGQFNDVTVHPRFPFITGGGLQDNGTFVGYGGATWYQLVGGDGGMVGFDPDDPRRIIANSQVDVYSVTVGNGSRGRRLPDLGPDGAVWAEVAAQKRGIGDEFKQLFVGIVEHHPGHSGHMLVGRTGAGFVGAASTPPGGQVQIDFTRLAAEFHPSSPAEVEVTALAYAPSDADHQWWMGTSRGEVFRTTDANASAWTRMTIPNLGAAWVSRIAVHPGNADLVAVATSYEPPADSVAPGSPGRVFLTFDQGGHWIDISGRAPATVSPTPLPPCPITALAFDRTDPRLYAGTLAGVYVIEYTGMTAGTAAAWRTFNNGLPLLLVTDLAFTPVSRRLRCSTYGRGMFECDLDGPAPPPARLFIRQHAIEEGRTYPRDPALHATLGGDPRVRRDERRLDLSTATRDEAFSAFNAFDIRVNAPPLRFFEGRLDGAEFDNGLTSDPPRPGETNFVFVQVHNSGASGGPPEAADVHLYVAHMAAAPPLLPDLSATFWATFPGPPLAGPWSRIGTEPVSVRPGDHVVARFAWVPGVDLLGDVALLALCTSAGDQLPGAGPAPPVVIRDLLLAERRAAARLVTIRPDVFIRDAVDDTGEIGSVAWGGRSPDIVVTQTAVNPATEFADLGDPAPGQPLRAGANRIYVRVHNRSAVRVSATVDLHFAPADDPSWWGLSSNQIAAGVAVADIEPHGWKFTAEIPWTPPDPKPHVLVALVRSEFDPDVPRPALRSDILEFWTSLASGSHSNNAAMRALRFEP